MAKHEYVVQRKLATYAAHGGVWEDIHCPVRVIRDGRVILEIETVETKIVKKNNIKIIKDKIAD